MKKLSFLPLIFFVLIHTCFSQKLFSEKKFDFSGLDKFWSLVSILEQDKHPSKYQWECLFNTPGYAALTESEFKKETFIQWFELVFMPSKHKQLLAYFDQHKGWTVSYLRHYQKVKRNKDDIKKLVGKLKCSSIAEDAVDLTSPWLPSIQNMESPKVSFVIFGPDARGYSPVVIDALNVLEGTNEDFVFLLAHEFHHFYRNKLLRYDRRAVSPEDTDILWVLDQLHAEGMADQINIKKGNNSSDLFKKMTDKYKKYFIQSPEIIRKIDNLLIKIYNSGSENRRKELTLELRKSIPMSGHPTGFYMANIIIESAGKNELIANVGNPFAFIFLYQTVSEKSGSPGFSKQSVQFLKKLEAKYIINTAEIY